MLNILTKIFPHFIELFRALQDNPIYLRQARKKYCRRNWAKINFSLPVILKGFSGMMELEWKAGRLNHARLSLMSLREILLGYMMPRAFGALQLIGLSIIVTSVIVALYFKWWLNNNGVKLNDEQELKVTHECITIIHAIASIGLQLMILNLVFFLDNFEDQVEQIGHSLSHRLGLMGAFQIASLFSFLMNSIPALLLAGVGAMFFSQSQSFGTIDLAVINWFIGLFTISNTIVFLFVIHLQLGGVLKRSAKEFRKSLRRLENQEMQQDESAIFGE